MTITAGVDLDAIRRAAERHGVAKLALFGSIATGGLGTDSDIDFLVDFIPDRPDPFENEAAAREFLGGDAIVDAWVADLELTDHGLVPRFNAAVMQRVIEAVHEPRWDEWEALTVPTLAVFAKHGMFGNDDRDALIRRRSQTDRIDLDGGSHDAHLDAFEMWIDALSRWLARERINGTHASGR